MPAPPVLLGDVIAGTRFLLRLPGFLRNPITVSEARAILLRRLERREADFLTLVKHAVYEHAGSPYRVLLNHVGCEYGELERLVNQEGVEGALLKLFRHGVYLTVDELKGRQAVVRGAFSLAVHPGQLRNPLAAAHVLEQSGGSRGAAIPVSVDLAAIRDRAVNECLVLQARGGSGWLHANWFVPGSWAISQLLQYSAFGSIPVRWFLQVDPSSPGLHPRYRWSGRAMRWGSLLAGMPLPRPVHVSLKHPLLIVEWMAEVLRAGGIPHLLTSASSAVRLCEAALEAGMALHGVQFHIGSEPITAKRLAVVRQAGAQALGRYGSSEAGPIGYGCLAPAVSDDHHVLQDLHAMIQPGEDGGSQGLPSLALLISSLRPTAPLILLNVSLGDQAVMVDRACGCPLERAGWTTHLHTIRSFEKLTSGGMNFLDVDVIRVLEEVLPARFGGGPTDYQLVEEETPTGHPQLRLVVHPAVGPLDEGAVVDAFLSTIAQGSGVERVMGLAWRDANLLRVERRTPYPTSAGKILHLHLNRNTPPRD